MKNVRLCSILCILLLSCSICAHAQTLIKGKVLDAGSKQPLEAATVSITGQGSQKAVTDDYGNFVLKATNKSESLAVSHIGYRTTSFTSEKTGNTTIELAPDVIKLDDVRLQATGIAKFSSLAKVDLLLNPVKNTQELLRIVPGLFIAQHAGGGKAEQIFLRGFDCDHGTDVQVSVDGMPVNMVSHAHGQGYADAHFIIPETINAIDFGAGPYYTEHGNLNTAGYVAFSTFKNIPKSEIKIEAGRFNTYRLFGLIDLLKKNKEKQSAYIAGEYYYTNGPSENKQHFSRFNVFGKYNATIAASTDLSFSASAFKSNWDASGQVPERAVESGGIGRFGSIDPSEGGNTERYNANLFVAHRFANGSSWTNQAYYSRYLFSLYSDFTFFLNDPVNGDEINQAEQRNVTGLLSSLKQKYFLGKVTLNGTYAAGLRYDATNNSKLAHVVKRQFIEYFKLGDIKEANAFAYVNQQASVGKFVINGGVRFDYFNFDYTDKLTAVQPASQYKSIISPKLNIQFNASKAVQFYVKSGKGFHSNDTRVVTANNGNEILPAAYGSDVGIIIKPVKNLLINVAAWTLYLQQEFVYVGDDGNVEPSGKTRRQGIDIIARYQFADHLFANANINFTKPRALGEAKGEDYIPLAPTATSTGGLFYKKQKGFNGGLTYRYIKSRPANEDNTIIAKGYFLTDASLNYTQPKYEIGIAMENIFNVKWNEAQFATESRLLNEPAAVTELNFTPGTPFFAKIKLAVFF